MIGVRLTKASVEYLDNEAERLSDDERTVTRSDVIRAALKAWSLLPERQRKP